MSICVSIIKLIIMKKLTILCEHPFYIKLAEEERLFMLYAKDKDVLYFLMFHPIQDQMAIELLYKRSQKIIDLFQEFHPTYARTQPTTELDKERFEKWLHASLILSPKSFSSDKEYYDYVESIHMLGEKRCSYTFDNFKLLIEKKEWKLVRDVIKNWRISKQCRALLIENLDPATLLFFITRQKFTDDDEQTALFKALTNYEDRVLGSYIIWRYCSYWSIGEQTQELIKCSENEPLIKLVNERNK